MRSLRAGAGAGPWSQGGCLLRKARLQGMNFPSHKAGELAGLAAQGVAQFTGPSMAPSLSCFLHTNIPLGREQLLSLYLGYARSTLTIWVACPPCVSAEGPSTDGTDCPALPELPLVRGAHVRDLVSRLCPGFPRKALV